MFNQIVTFLLDVIGGLLAGACLLRAYMQWQRVPFQNPVGNLVFALTDWLVMPLRKLVPPTGWLDLSSLLGALLVQMAQYVLLYVLLGAPGMVVWVPLMAFFGLLRVAVSGLIGMLIVYAVLSWVQTQSPVADIVERLVAPVLRPLRRLIPLVGGVDLTPLVALVILQISMMVLGHLQAGLFFR